MASGDTLLIFHPYNNEPPSSSYATLDTRNQRPVLDFDGASNESAVFSAIMPQHYDNGGVTMYLHWASDGTSGDVDWDGAFERVGDSVLDVDSDDFATAQSTDGTSVPGTSGYVEITSIAFTNGAQMDSVVAGEGFRIKITRDAASDTSTDDVNLFWVELRET